MTAPAAQIAVVAIPLLAAIASKALAASMFIAAFVAALAIQVHFKHAGRHAINFTEDWGQFLNLAVFFLFGILVARDFANFTPALLLYALLSLTLIRMLPVAISLYGTRLATPTILFVGWFGPRGLASIVLGVVYLEHTHHVAHNPTIVLATMATVLLSIFAHGLSALPFIHLYARRIARLPPTAPELQSQ